MAMSVDLYVRIKKYTMNSNQETKKLHPA